MALIDDLADEARKAPESGILAVVNHGRLKPDLVPLWAGESDLVTPAFICRAAAEALENGETFYTWNRGIPELRQALARFHQRHFGRFDEPERFIVTGSGMQAIQMAIQAVAAHGSEVVCLTPAWPNFAAALGIAGGRPVEVPLEFSGDRWIFDPGRLETAITAQTRALFVNSPGNPTGWTASADELRSILELARRHGLWVIADETYALFHFGKARAASFADMMEDGDRVIFTNTFSKNWAMTGWRVGWLGIHPSLQQTFENLVQYSTSGVPQFLQKGAIAALDEGDGFITEQVERAEKARDIICDALLTTGRVELARPAGAFYLFFKVDGMGDTDKAAIRIVDEALVGLAPGTAFGKGGEPFLRLCFHRRIDQIETAAERLSRWIAAN